MQFLEWQIETGTEQQKINGAELVQHALELLVVGEEIDDDYMQLLAEQDRYYAIRYGGRIATFDLSEVILYRNMDDGPNGPKTKNRVIVPTSTFSKQGEYMWLMINNYGETNFTVEEIKEDPQ